MKNILCLAIILILSACGGKSPEKSPEAKKVENLANKPLTAQKVDQLPQDLKNRFEAQKSTQGSQSIVADITFAEGAMPAPRPRRNVQPQPTTRTPEPAQNAKGVWHFTCSKGCPGGGGSRTDKCKTCGGALAHNQAYHQ